MPPANALTAEADRIAEAAQNLPLAELDVLVERLLTLRARRRAPTLSQNEADLLSRIEQAVPLALRQRQKALHDAGKKNPWTPAQREEFLRLTNEVETAEAARVELLAQLATLRGVSLPALMHQLGLGRA